MKLNEIFEKDITRPIDGVIKADDTTHLQVEVEEYVLTNETEKALSQLLEAYTSSTTDNGVWISGFFGSGKSHLLKMLAHLLGDVDGQQFRRDQVTESFAGKTEDHLLKGSLKKAASIPAKSILFNIDQLADVAGSDKTDAILKVFVKVFNIARGYYGLQPHVARFERDLDTKGLLQQFRTTYHQIAGIPWEDGRDLDVLEEANVAKAFAQVTNASGASPENILEKYRDSYSVSVEEFAEEVVTWLDKQPTGTRLNFFVDEVGQFIGGDTKLMLNLQTIAESLNSKAKGRSWIVVTSQEAMDKVIGDPTKTLAMDFSKIQARFATKVALTSADVEEVIRKRLLEKNASGSAGLAAVYSSQSGHFKTIFDFVGGRTYPNYSSEDRFIETYPLVNYQFPLFQSALVGLSENNAFTGRHQAVGERSMLGVVQQVAKEMVGAEVGELASFDRLFSGIRDTVQSLAKRAIDIAENSLPDQDSDVTKLAVRLLKALFLVKYVKDFKATARNLAVLVYDRFGLDPSALDKDVKDALALLEAQTYIQRNGDVYEYLTNEEQEIEAKIKQVDLDSSEIGKRLFDLLSQDVVKSNKFTYKTGQNYAFGYKIDESTHGPQQLLTVHFLTPEYPHDLTTIRAHSTGLDEVRVVLPDADAGLFADLRLLLKTDKYVKQAANASSTPVQQRILAAKSQQNFDRKRELVERFKTAVGKATLIVYAADVASKSEAADQHVFDGLAVLIAKAFPQLSTLGGKTFTESDITKFVQPVDQGLVTVDSTLTEAAKDVYNVGVSMKVKTGQSVTVKTIVDQFEGKPYGWDRTSILAVVAYLFGDSQITIEHNGNLLKRSEVPGLLKNSQQLANLKVGIQKSFDDAKVTALRKFVQDFFDEASTPTAPLELARFGADKLKGQVDRLHEARAAYPYPFMAALDPAIALLESVVGKADEWYLADFDQADELREAKDDVLDPIRAFLSGQQRTIYDKVAKSLADSEDNLSFLAKGVADDVRSRLDDPGIFRGNKVAQLQSAADSLREQIDTVVKDEQQKAVAAIGARRGLLADSDDFKAATEDARQQVLGEVDFAIVQVEAEHSIAKIKLAATTFAQETFPRLLAQLVASRPVTAVPPTDGTESSEGGEVTPPAPPAVKPIVPIGQIQVTSAKVVLSTGADVDEYVDALRSALHAAIADGKRVTR